MQMHEKTENIMRCVLHSNSWRKNFVRYKHYNNSHTMYSIMIINIYLGHENNEFPVTKIYELRRLTLTCQLSWQHSLNSRLNLSLNLEIARKIKRVKNLHKVFVSVIPYQICIALTWKIKDGETSRLSQRQKVQRRVFE